MKYKFWSESKKKTGQGWCKRCEGDREQSKNNTTAKGQDERNLFGSLSQPEQKRPLKRAVQASVPGRKIEQCEPRNVWLGG